MSAADAEAGRRDAEAARRWIESHPAGWADVLATARALTGRGLRVRRDTVYAFLMLTAGSRVQEDEARECYAHDLWAGLARYVKRELPDADVVFSGRCRIDAAYPTPMDLPPLRAGEGRSGE